MELQGCERHRWSRDCGTKEEAETRGSSESNPPWQTFNPAAAGLNEALRRPRDTRCGHT